MPEDFHLVVATETDMHKLGADLIAAVNCGGVIALNGDLGTGKTTLVRGVLRSLGITRGVRSPTYTLIELYAFEKFSIAHFDLYRLADAEELEYLGFRDYLDDKTICLIEWPERAAGVLRDIGLEIFFDYDPAGRSMRFVAHTDWGRRITGRLQAEAGQSLRNPR